MKDWETWIKEAELRQTGVRKDEYIAKWQANWGKYFLRIPSLPDDCGVQLLTYCKAADYEAIVPDDTGEVVYYDLATGFPQQSYTVFLEEDDYGDIHPRRAVAVYEYKNAEYDYPDFGNVGVVKTETMVWNSDSFYRRRKLVEYFKRMQTFNTDWVPGSETSRILGAVLEERMFERVGDTDRSKRICLWVEKSRIGEGSGKLAEYFRDEEGLMRRAVRSGGPVTGNRVGRLHKGFESYEFTDETLEAAESVFVTV